jgi:putative NADH-flavin reductase
VRVAVLGATGRTGRAVVDELLLRSHEVVVLVREPRTAALPSEVATVGGDARDPSAVAAVVRGAQSVVSALGPRRKDVTLHREVAPLLVEAMRRAGVRRFVGISGAGVDVPGDAKSRRDRVVSALIQRLGGRAVQDKAIEQQVWAASGLDWTLVRPPRLVDGDASGEVEHAASRSPRTTRIRRTDLARFVVDCLEQELYVGAAPLVAGR